MNLFKKTSIIIVAFVLVMSMTIIKVSADSTDENDVNAYNEVEKSVHEKLNQKENKLLEKYEDNEKVQQVIADNYHYDDHGDVSLKISSIDEFSKKTGMDLETSKEYINAANIVLDVVQEKKDQYSTSPNAHDPGRGGGPGCGYTEETTPQFQYVSHYCQGETEQILDNISRNTDILAGISLAGGFFNKYLGLVAGLGAAFSSLKYNTINGHFRTSDYRGVSNEVTIIPAMPDSSYWGPLQEVH